MTTQKLLEMLAQAALGAEYQAALCRIYEENADAVEPTETQYAAAKEFLAGTKPALLAQYEDTCRQIREFSGRYGFQAGLLCGFKQYFTADNAPDGGFEQHVGDQIAMMPYMTRHYENYANIERRNTLYAALCDGENAQTQEQLVSLDCAWSQRARSASIHGFYCGYRGAMAILDQVMPAGCGSARIRGKCLNMEHTLGYIRSYSEIERGHFVCQ